MGKPDPGLIQSLMKDSDITEAYVKKILVVGLYGAGLGWAQIAELLGMTPKQVYYIVKGQKEGQKERSKYEQDGKDTAKL